MQRVESYQYEQAARPATTRDLTRALEVPDEVPLAVPEDCLVVTATSDDPGGPLDTEQVVITIDTTSEFHRWYPHFTQAPDPLATTPAA